MSSQGFGPSGSASNSRGPASLGPARPALRITFITVVTTLAMLLTGCGVISGLRGNSGGDESAPATPGATVASQGCTDTGKTPAVGVSETIRVEVKGTERSFIVRLPTHYSSTIPLPLVLNFHGMGSNGHQQMLVSGLATVADSEKFIAVAPNAANEGVWSLPTDGARAFAAESAYLEAMNDYLDKNYCIDKQRVYSMGMSQGSAMTFLLACSSKSQIAAFGGVGATFYRPVCGRSAPAPIMYFHGTADKVVPIGGGKTPGNSVGPAMEAMGEWAVHNKCGKTPDKKTTQDVTTFVWSGCAGDASVIYNQIDGGGHTWPGTDPVIAGFLEERLGKTTQTVAASQAMWDFFEQHTLSERTSQ